MTRPQSQKNSTVVPWSGQDDGDRIRHIRGLAIAESKRIERNRLGYRVPSQTGNGSYLVNLEHEPFCTCEDFENRRQPCKHVYAVQALLNGSEQLNHPESQPVAARISQPWAAYNAAQVREGEFFAILLRQLCDAVPQPPQPNGRPRLPIADMLYAMGLKGLFHPLYATGHVRHTGRCRQRANG